MRNYFLICTSFLLVVSCNTTESPTPMLDRDLGKYVYLDDNEIHHVNSLCIKLRHGKDNNGHEIYAMHPIDTSEFYIKNSDFFRICSRCVDDKIYEHLLVINSRNKPIANRHWLYDKFVEANYDMPDYETYLAGIINIETRRQLFRIAQKENWDVGESEEDFSKMLGF